MSDVIERSVREVLELSSSFEIEDDMRLFTDLGFDSLKITSLMLVLEAELGRPLILSELLGRAGDPTALTVGQLRLFIAPKEAA